MTRDEEIEAFIVNALEQNFEVLKLESGHSLAAAVKQTALNQSLLYWIKLKDVAERITETEVRLNLPGNTTPQGRKFGIEGVVDIVRADNKVVMYDIKTHDAESVRKNADDYERQLNIYAHIWQNLRGQPLDDVAIIATAYPDEVKEALRLNNQEGILRALENWNPLVEMELNPKHVEKIIQDFGHVVDCIENGEFEPASLEKLQSRYGDQKVLFATSVCRNCDARFSCDSYRHYATNSSSPKESALLQYIPDYGSELDQQDWLSNELEDLPSIEDLE